MLYALYYRKDFDLWLLLSGNSATTLVELSRLRQFKEMGWFDFQFDRLEDEPWELLYEFKDVDTFISEYPEMLL